MTETKEAKPAPTPPPELQDRIVTTDHTYAVGKKKLQYTATCGTAVLREYDGDARDGQGKRSGDKARATMFFTAYTLKASGALKGDR